MAIKINLGHHGRIPINEFFLRSKQTDVSHGVQHPAASHAFTLHRTSRFSNDRFFTIIFSVHQVRPALDRAVSVVCVPIFDVTF